MQQARTAEQETAQGGEKDAAETYYDSSDADSFYHAIWGGEDIHVGIYADENEPIFAASRRTVRRLADLCCPSAGARVLDMGAGYGGAARYLVQRFDCQVTCLNLSETQNRRNGELTAQAGLSGKVRVVHGDFAAVPSPNDSYDLVWSQDSILHSPRRSQVIAEARRVLKPGGALIFTDPMQSDDCPSGVLDEVLARIHLPSLASFAFYRESGTEMGFVEEHSEDLTPHLVTHYARVRAELVANRARLQQTVSEEYLSRMESGLGHWIGAGNRGYLAWGILKFRVP